MTTTVEFCDNNFTKLWELESGTFTGVVRRNEPGEWSVDMHLDEVPPDVLSTIQTIRVRDESRVIFAGWSRADGNGGGGTSRTIDAAGRRCRIDGVDCWYWLKSRVVFPVPSTNEPWATAADVRAGVGGDVIRQFIEANTGVSALAERMVPGLVVIGGSVGTSGEWSGRLQSLSDLVGRIASESGVVVEPTLSADLVPTVYVRDESDRTATVVIADIADLAEAESQATHSRSTWVLGAGSGVGASRMFRSYDNTGGTGVSRIEKVVENTTATTSNELYQYAQATAREDGWAIYVNGRLNEVAAEHYQYLTDYRLGDLISLQVSGFRFSVPIAAVEISVTPERTVETPVLGTYSPDRLRAIDKRLLGLNERLDTNIA